MEIKLKWKANTNAAPSVADATTGALLLSVNEDVYPTGMMRMTLRLNEGKFCQNLYRIFMLKRQEKNPSKGDILALEKWVTF